MRHLSLLFVLLIFCKGAACQQAAPGGFIINGAAVDSLSGEGVPGLEIQILNSKENFITGQEGRFSFKVTWGSRIMISGHDYKPRFITFTSQPLSELTISMLRQSTTLTPVVVSRRRAGYSADSAARHATYARTLARTHDGGIMSPISFIAEKLSKRSRQLFRFQKDFAAGEEERFIDSRYTPALVASQTKLSGDTLAYFMNAYPMPEDIARTETDIELKQWVRWNFKDWIAKGKPVPKINIVSPVQH